MCFGDEKFLRWEEVGSIVRWVMVVKRIGATDGSGVDSCGSASSFYLERALRSRSPSLKFVAGADFGFLCVSAASNAASNQAELEHLRSSNSSGILHSLV